MEVPARERQGLIRVEKSEGKATVPGMDEAACAPSLEGTRLAPAALV